jgi:hypothetical protein
MCAVEVFSIVKDIALAGAACVTAYVAYTGLEKWQKELRGKANFDVARELAKSVYMLRDQISYCRSPFAAAAEFPEDYYKGERARKHTPEEEGQAWAYIYSKRWEPVGTAMQAFDASILEAEALWGKTIKEKTTELRKCVRSLQVDIESFIQNKYSGGANFKDDKFRRMVEEGVWDIKSEKNELTQRINKAIEGIEAEIRPHLSRS